MMVVLEEEHAFHFMVEKQEKKHNVFVTKFICWSVKPYNSIGEKHLIGFESTNLTRRRFQSIFYSQELVREIEKLILAKWNAQMEDGLCYIITYNVHIPIITSYGNDSFTSNAIQKLKLGLKFAIYRALDER